MIQSKRETIIEIVSSTLVGAILAWGITYTIIKNVDNLELASTLSVICCTVASLLRSYFVRRYFARRVCKRT